MCFPFFCAFVQEDLRGFRYCLPFQSTHVGDQRGAGNAGKTCILENYGEIVPGFHGNEVLETSTHTWTNMRPTQPNRPLHQPPSFAPFHSFQGNTMSSNKVVRRPRRARPCHMAPPYGVWSSAQSSVCSRVCRARKDKNQKSSKHEDTQKR